MKSQTVYSYEEFISHFDRVVMLNHGMLSITHGTDPSYSKFPKFVLLDRDESEVHFQEHPPGPQDPVSLPIDRMTEDLLSRFKVLRLDRETFVMAMNQYDCQLSWMDSTTPQISFNVSEDEDVAEWLVYSAEVSIKEQEGRKSLITLFETPQPGFQPPASIQPNEMSIGTHISTFLEREGFDTVYLVVRSSPLTWKVTNLVIDLDTMIWLDDETALVNTSQQMSLSLKVQNGVIQHLYRDFSAAEKLARRLTAQFK